MDGDSRMPLWGSAELGAGPSNGAGNQASVRKLDFGADLQLGGGRWRDRPRVPTTTSKRGARTPGGGAQNASCLVDGCGSDLGRCREYHRRHKVCEAHSKTPVVMVGGLEQRFCQQCSRFHLLVEFDEVKRSCRKRLDGHNRRRRKPQPESVSSGTVFSNHQGTRFSPYPQIFPTVAADPTWPAAVKTEDDIYTRHSPMHLLDRAHHHHLVQHFPLSDQPAALDPSICQPILNAAASAESSSNRGKIFADALTQVLDSECALSLLSLPPRPLLPYGGGLGPGRYWGPCRGSNHASTVGSSCSGMEDENAGSTILVSGGGDAEMNCEGPYGVGGERSLDGGLQALHFSWQ